MLARLRFIVVTISLVALVSCSVFRRRQAGAEPPYAAEQSIAMMQIAPGYRVEPFATEPSVVSPVAMEIDEDGRIYVVEDQAYPLDVDGKVGRVKLLQDTNGDGNSTAQRHSQTSS